MWPVTLRQSCQCDSVEKGYFFSPNSEIDVNDDDDDDDDNLDPYLTPYTKFKSKWIVEQSIKLKTIELLEETVSGFGLKIS